MGIRIVTNNVPRDLLMWEELNEAEREEFDWITDPENTGLDFFRYRNWVYCTQDFMRFTEHAPFPKIWEGYSADSAFSGVLIRYDDHFERIVVGTYYEVSDG